ncbi:MAG: glycosyltransferase [Streptosporangiales bacterium]|nr:glycosyltransferase [Streptosporangiales bacterium]
MRHARSADATRRDATRRDATPRRRPPGCCHATPTRTDQPTELEGAALPRFAAGPVLAIAGATSLVLLLNSGRGGYLADEVYFIRAGNRPSFGYADQPPLVPLLARFLDDLFPGLAGVAAAADDAARRRGRGAERAARQGVQRVRGRAQWLAAAAYPLSPLLLGFGRVLATYSIDPVLWTLAIWLLVRWLRLWHHGVRADRYLLLFGLVIALDVQVKYLVGGFLVVLAVAVLAVGPRRLLLRPMLWLGAAVTVLTMIPGVLWQASHGWPQLEMAQVLSKGAKLIWEPAWFVPAVVVGAGLPGGFLLCAGLWRLVRTEQLRPYRCLGWAAIGTTVLFAVTGGGFYYAAGLLPLGVAAATPSGSNPAAARWWRWVPTVPACVVAAVLVGVSTFATATPGMGLSGGWSEVAKGTAAAYRDLPAQQRDRTVVMAHWYFQAAAVEKFGPRYGLPERVYSSNRGYWYFGAPPAGTERVLYVGGSARELRRSFGNVRRVDTVDGLGSGTAGSNKDVPLWECTDPRWPWPELWRDQLRRPF